MEAVRESFSSEQRMQSSRVGVNTMETCVLFMVVRESVCSREGREKELGRER